jgi:hypothetical protein
MRVFALLVVLWVSTAEAQTVECQTTKIFWGGAPQFKVNAQGMNVASVTWDYQWSGGVNCNPPWVAMNDTGIGPVTVYSQYVGTLTVRATITIFGNGVGGGQQVVKKTAGIDVPNPDGIRILAGDNKPTPHGGDCGITFMVTSKGEDSVYGSIAYAQEKNTNFKDARGNPLAVGGGAWKPTLQEMDQARKDGQWYIVGPGEIFDKKVISSGFGYPANTTVRTSTQEIRLAPKDPCGNAMTPISLGKFTVTIAIPNDPTKYILTHTLQ